MSRIAITCVLILPLAGCGDSGPASRPETEKIRTWLKEVVEKGALDDKAEAMRDNVPKLADEGVKNVDDLKKRFDELLILTDPAAINAKGNEILGKLPKESPPTDG